MRIDQPDEDGGRADDADTPDTPDAPDANEARAADERAVPAASAASAGEDAVFRAHAIDQAYDRVREIERGIVTPAMKRIEAEDPERRLAGLGHSLKRPAIWVQFHPPASLDGKEETHWAVREAAGRCPDASRAART